jgi:hypothetical protein
MLANTTRQVINVNLGNFRVAFRNGTLLKQRWLGPLLVESQRNPVSGNEVSLRETSVKYGVTSADKVFSALARV